MIVELLTAVLFALMLHRSLALHQDVRFIALELATTWVFVGLLIVISFIDLDFTIIPDKIVYPGLALGLLLAIFTAVVEKNVDLILSKVLGAVIGAAIIILIAVAGSALFHKEAMGGGDVKLMAMIGIYLGWWPHIPVVLISASLFGSIVGLCLIAVRRKKIDSRIPFGPFLACGALLSLLYGDSIWNWYRNLMGL